MKLASALSLLLGLLSTPLALAVNPYNMIPEPAKLELSSGKTTNLKVLGTKKVGNLGKEGYVLKITPKGVQISCSTPYGAAMAQSTLKQLKDALAESPEGIPCGTITDRPNFEWRGMMVDLGRYYYPMEDLYKFVDAMHYYKYNVLHLHLTEDQGWRLEIPGYDKLKTIGSVRPSAPEGQENSLLANEGMYTAKDMQDLVKYCAKRGIDVLPEIEFPGHNMALAASYPEFCCNKERPTLWTHGGVSNRLICPQKSGTKKFIKDVFNTVQQTFPFEFVHIGGDECPMGEWKNCPDCKKYRTSKGYGDDVEAEMSDFTKDLGRQLGTRGKKPILWYDIKKSYYHKGETVMSWLPGEFPNVIDKTKEQGINLIVTPQFKYYFARCQQQFPKDDPKFRPGGKPILLKECYEFDPRDGRSAEETSHIKGINLCMWAEWIPSAELLMYMTFPRAIAVSENSWGDFNNHPTLDELEQKLEVHKKRYQKHFGYTLERTPANKPVREDSITPERVKEINELFEKGQQSVR
jgi:hexosaminidase